MSADREMDHLENMSGMNGSRHWNQPYCYMGDAEEDAAEDAQPLAPTPAVPTMKPEESACVSGENRGLSILGSAFEQTVRSAVASLSVTGAALIREVR